MNWTVRNEKTGRFYNRNLGIGNRVIKTGLWVWELNVGQEYFELSKKEPVKPLNILRNQYFILHTSLAEFHYLHIIKSSCSHITRSLVNTCR